MATHKTDFPTYSFVMVTSIKGTLMLLVFFFFGTFYYFPQDSIGLFTLFGALRCNILFLFGFCFKIPEEKPKTYSACHAAPPASPALCQAQGSKTVMHGRKKANWVMKS